MDQEAKIDLILQKVSAIEIQTAVQEQKITTMGGYFKWVGGVLAGCVISLATIALKLIIFI